MATKGNTQAGKLLKTWPLVLELDFFPTSLFVYSYTHQVARDSSLLLTTDCFSLTLKGERV